MSQNERNFARRRITWKIKNFNQANNEKLGSEEALRTSNFAISINNNETEWQIGFLPNRLDSNTIRLYLALNKAEIHNFSLKFSAFVKKADKTLQLFFSAEKNSEDYKKGMPKVITCGILSLDSLPIGKFSLDLQFELHLLENPKIETNKFHRRHEMYENLLNNKRFSDFSFICSDGERIYVNQCVIAVQCPAFAAVFEAKMEESQTSEAEMEESQTSGAILDEEIDSKTMLELLRFLYCGKIYEIGDVDYKLLEAADKYQITDLKELCASSLIGNVDSKNALKSLVLADLHHQPHLKANCIDFIKCDYEVIRNSQEWQKLSNDLMREVMESLVTDPLVLSFESDAAKY